MRAIKKVAALVTGATLIGATVMGAMAADLANYPAPFVTGCSFSGLLVVGEAAAASDVTAAIDISNTLAVSGTSTGTAGADVSAVGESAKFETNTNVLNVGEGLTTVKTVALDEDDLPIILADGTFRSDDGVDYDYEQKITMNQSIAFNHWTDSDYKDKEPALGLRIPKNNYVFHYELDFTKDVESTMDTAGDLDDIEDTTLTMLGKTYDVVEADNGTKISLQLMTGAEKDVLEQGQIKTYNIDGKDYEVEVTYIGGTTSQVKFKVNGESTKLLAADQTDKLSDGTQIGVREILEEEAGEVTADQVEFYIGAEKITLTDTEKLELNDEDVDDILVNIDEDHTGTNSKSKITKIRLDWKADDDLFIAEDSEVTMPALGAVKLSYGGWTTAGEEETTFENSGDYVLELKTTLKTGDASIELLGSNEASGFDTIGGDGTDEGLRTAAGVSATMTYNSTSDQYFVVTYLSGADGESYLVEVTDVDDTDGVDFKDAATGATAKYEDKKAGVSFTIGSATITVNNFNETADQNVSLTAGANTYFDRIVTEDGLLIYLPVANTTTLVAPAIDLAALPISYTFHVEEEDKDNNIGAGKDLNFTVGHTSSNEVEVKNLSLEAWAALSGDSYYEIGDTDEFVGYANSSLGTKILLDKDPDQDSLKIVYYGEESYGNVFLSEVAARFEAGIGGATSVCPVSVPAAALDSEVASTSAQNLLVVGGPCANSVTAEVMGVAGTVPACLAGFEEGKAMIKLYDTGAGKTAMLVAGATAMDTRRAGRVLKSYSTYDLSGDEVTVSGTSLTDVSVTKVA